MANIVDDIIAWESGDMDEDQEREFFQRLINDGTCWTLQGCYGRRAMELIRSGECHAKD